MLNPCSVHKWVVIELCEEIGIDTIQIANFEFFSSTFKNFKVFGSNKYCITRDCWILLGQFTALKVRQLQQFHLREPAWFKYKKEY